MIKNKPRGGARIGAGAPKKLELAKSHTIRLTDAQWGEFKKLGGISYLKNILASSLAKV